MERAACTWRKRFRRLLDEYQNDCATACSWKERSARYGKFYHAKKWALAPARPDPGRYREDTLEDHRLLHLRPLR